MRVVMVSDVYFPRINGVSTAIQTYRESLRAHGVEVLLVAPDYGHGGGEDWVSRVPARPVPGDREDRLARWSGMQEAVERAIVGGCDLIHVQTPFVAHYVGARAARRYDVPVLATYHTLFEEYLKHYAPLVPAPWLRALARAFSRRQCNALDAVIVPSKAIFERLGSYGVTAPMHILPTAVSIAPPSADGRVAFRARHGIEPARPVALFVGRVAHEKNIDFLIDVIDLARQSIPEILLIVAGEGPAQHPLRKTVRARALDKNVLFLGFMDRTSELPDCYAAADTFAFASCTETQGLVLLEAMASGLPVVALAEMGTVDLLGARRGAVVPENDVGCFARALCQVLSDEPLRRQLGEDGRAYAEKWSEPTLAGAMAALYRTINAAHAGKRVGEFDPLALR